MRIVALGGGTGLSMLLRGLKNHLAAAGPAYPPPPRTRQGGQLRHAADERGPIADLAAIVTVTDDGGSSGRLRREYRILPPGDLRNCMVALSQDEALLSRLFQYRFQRRGSLKGHSFGNLFLAALTKVTGDFPEAVRLCSEVLAIRGRIFPSTSQLVSLRAELANGREVAGETRISRSRARIRRVWLEPRRVKPLAGTLEAIRRADLILLGPGSLYTSIIPNLLVAGVADAIRHSRATRVYIANLMTQPGETTHYSLSDHLRAIQAHGGRRLVDWVIANRRSVSPEVAKRYHAQGAEPVALDADKVLKLKVKLLLDNLLEEHGLIRHDSRRLARVVVDEFLLHPKRH